MADYSVIANVSEELLRTLRRGLCPEPIQSAESIQPASPADRNADFQLGLFLYDIREMGEYRTSGQVRHGDVRRFPPKSLTVNFLLFLNSKAQIASGAQAEQRILGRALQVLADRPVVDLAAVQPYAGEPDENPSVTLLSMSFDDKSKIWSALSVPYQAGIYFSVAPLLLDSLREEPFTRVTETQMRLRQQPWDGQGV